MKKLSVLKHFSILILLAIGFNSNAQKSDKKIKRMSVIFDTDANNELDDQQAMAYLFFNSQLFDTKAVTVNATENGGNIDEQYAEADRVMRLCKVSNKIPLLKGANGSFSEIEKGLSNPNFDGYKAVNFIIDEAKKHKSDKLIVLAVGKLTNIALALKSYANSCGLAPEDSETFTDEISVFVGGNLIAKENMY